MVDRNAFRDAMSRLGAAVNIVATDGPAGRAGFTASAVCSVSDDPPSLLVCMNRSSAQAEAFLANGVLCVNVLGGAHQALSALFAGACQDMAARYAAARWTVLKTGAPVLEDACAAFDCRIVQVTQMGTHNVLFCHVEAARAAGSPGLIYFDRAYHQVGEAAAPAH